MSEGIYYVVREPDGWRLAIHKFAEGEDYQHQAMWENDLAPALACQWARTLDTDLNDLSDLLKILAFAFPRGRVTKLKGKFVFYHGNDLKRFMRVSKRAIEQAFCVVGNCRWQLDDHERCVGFEKEEVQQALRLTEDWPAA